MLLPAYGTPVGINRGFEVDEATRKAVLSA